LGIKFLHLTNIQIAGYRATKSLPWLLRFLSDIGKFNQLEDIKLEVGIPDYEEGLVDWSDWKEVDYVLAGPHFKSLRSMTMTVFIGKYSSFQQASGTLRFLVT
jgi:hypothetical protein